MSLAVNCSHVWPVEFFPQGPSEVPEDEGYGAQFQKQKNKPRKEYKKYTLDDYRKLNKEVRLGGLGPDRGNKAVQEKVFLF